MTDESTPRPSGAAPAAGGRLVSTWLALLALAVIVVVVGIGGFVLRGMVAASPQRSDPRAAIAERATAVAESPDDATTRLELALAYQTDGQYAAALAQYDRVLQLDPKNATAFYNKGVIHMTLGQAKAGETALWDALEIDAAHELAAKELGDYYAAKGQYKSLLVAVGPVVEAKPGSADLQRLAGLGYERTGRADLAEKHYRLALELAPGMKAAIEGLARLGAVAP